jgi:dinuclear metal center YbgI/SA1388 family protein
MQIRELDAYFRSHLDIEGMQHSDASLNGLQVGLAEGEVKKAAFAVDACMETFRRAVEWGAELLFVHHGLFWGKPLAVTGDHYRRIRFLLENELALYAAHLPLDMQPEFGNNAGIAAALGLQEIEPFAEHSGWRIGFKGRLPEPQHLDRVLKALGLDRGSALGVLPFGPERIETVGVVSGGADKDIGQAMAEGLDLFITGEVSHQVYHYAAEGGINLVGGGHYHTETYGPRLLAEKCAADTGIETTFIDVPTGL